MLEIRCGAQVRPCFEFPRFGIKRRSDVFERHLS
jgi:hypothetical protein